MPVGKARRDEAAKARPPPEARLGDDQAALLGVLRRIAAERPATEEALRAIHGIGPRKLQRYGRAIHDLVRSA